MQEEECPNREAHTPQQWDGSYLRWEKWVEEMSHTHRQTRCKSCGLWVIWVPKTTRSGKSSDYWVTRDLSEALSEPSE